jgi:hypothetical protein
VYLEPLASQGGGTLVHLPLPPDNPLLDRGPMTGCPAYDQRGRTRPQDGDADGQAACDIGAVEVQPVVSTVQSVTAPGVYNFDMGAGSSDVVMTVNQGGCLDAVTVTQQDTSHPDASSAIQSGVYWQIGGGACNTGFSLDLTLPHDGLTDPMICVLLNGVWDCARDTFDSTTVTRRNVNHFSAWTVGENPSGGIAPAVSTGRSSANLLLAWPHNTANSSGYIVWYSPSPYFSPGGPDVTRLTVPAPGGYTHNGVIGNLQRFYYLVQGIGGNTIASEPSNRVGKFEFALTAGAP